MKLQDATVGILIICVILMFIIPLPSTLLDVLLTINITASIIILLNTIVIFTMISTILINITTINIFM